MDWAGLKSERKGLTATGAAAAVATVRGAAALRQANGIRAALQGAAGGLANAADNVRGALQGLAEEADDTGHFYRGLRFSERAGPRMSFFPTQISVPSARRASTP